MNGTKFVALLLTSVGMMTAQSAFDHSVDHYFDEDFSTESFLRHGVGHS
jgi:hypothetical protein